MLYKNTKKTTHPEHIYLTCILFGDITLCNDFLSHVLVNLQVGHVLKNEERSLSESVEKARH